MEKIFLFLYDIFRVRRRLFFTIVTVFILLTAFLASRIKFEEDITKMLYGGDNTAILRDVVDQSKFLDKIIVNVTFTDTGYKPQPYELSSYADKLADTLLSDGFSEYVQTLTYTVNENITGQLFDIIYDNLPVFLEESDYRRLDSLATPAGAKLMAENVYNNLLSPSGFAIKEMIIRDPSSMSSIALGRMSSYQNDESYIIIDGRIFSRDGRNLLMFISPVHSSKETSENLRFIDMLDGAIRQVTQGSDPEIRIEYFGTVAVAAANAGRLKKDIRLTLTITIILLSLIINFSIKKKKLFPFIFLPAVVGVLMALAAIYLIQGSMSVISLSIGTVIMAITVDYALHITTHFKHKHSVLQTIKDVSFPIIVCGFATAFEFISLLFVSSESLHELGMLAAISVITAAFFTMVVLPHILDVTKNVSDETEEKNYLEKVLDRITNYNFHKRSFSCSLCLFIRLSLFFMPAGWALKAT
jgi:predicted exporter